MALRREVWDPAQRWLPEVTRLFVVPDGALHLVSYATLRAPGGEYLIESGPLLHRLTAEKDLATSSERTAEGALLALGGADFDSLPDPPPEEGPDDLLHAALPGTGNAAGTVYRGHPPTCRAFDELRFARLPGSADEVADVVRLWRARKAAARHTAPRDEDVLVLQGPEAREERFKRLAGRFRHLHLATHGFFLDPACLRGGGTQAEKTASHSRAGAAPELGGNPLLLSGLALAGANRRSTAKSEQEDGVLTAAEIASLDLSGVGAVVLSGCATGLGDVAPGEGVLGLQRAFRIAGARRVIMSLWMIQDQSTRAWMRALYEARNTGLADAASVRGASLRILRKRRADGRSTHPFFWGAFIASGY
jgi:CHAT domain-containing protein